ncbi:cupin fold metalloprotein, WbuC family [Candidatus Shapirobacteria bacterium]|nr:cupin fold metalloprotein, WbuC family [Candidatus Shapirobacteria bacterium]
MRVISKSLIDDLIRQAKKSPRQRAIFRFHRHQEPVQRMLNAIEVGSYIPPHKHENPDKVEAFVILKGKIAILRFDNQGKIIQKEILDEKGPVYGVDIAPGEWHMMMALKKECVVYEVIQGPYQKKTHKKFAPWAPDEEATQEAKFYLRKIKKDLGLID